MLAGHGASGQTLAHGGDTDKKAVSRGSLLPRDQYPWKTGDYLASPVRSRRAFSLRYRKKTDAA